MRNSIVVYTLKSENPKFTDMQMSYNEALHMMNMGIIRHCPGEIQVIREGDTTVTVYVHRRVGS